MRSVRENLEGESVSALHFNVSGDPLDDQPTIVTDNPPPTGTRLSGQFSGVEGQPPNRFSVTVPPELTGGATVTYQHWQGEAFRVIVPPGDGDWEAALPPCQPPEDSPIAMIYTPPTVTLPELRADGQFLRTDTGDRFTIIDRTDFALYERYLREGADAIKPVLAERQAVGFNMARIFLLNTSVHHLLPWEWPNFYSDLPRFCALLAQYGTYGNFVVFTQAQNLMPDLVTQQNHLRAVYDALRDVPCVISKVNEQNQHDNGVRPEILAAPKPQGARFLLSNGSNGSDSDTVEPVADGVEYHIIGWEYQRKVGHNTMEVADAHDRFGWCSESQRFPDNDRSLIHAYDAARAAALLCAGSTFHSVPGKLAMPFGSTLPYAQEWARGAKSVDLEYCIGRYTHRTDLEGGDVIRAYSRLSHLGEYVVTIRQ